MAQRTTKNEGKSVSAEERIKEAARRIFTERGFAGTRTRDIAEASGLNMALINYYFRSKENLFDIIMMEQLQLFIHSVTGLLNETKTSLAEKIELLVSHYIDMLTENQALPFFIMNEINRHPEKLITQVGIDRNSSSLYIVKQWQEFSRKVTHIDPVHLFINIISLTVFPFVASPMIRNRTGMSVKQFNKLMAERKKLIPMWIESMLSATDEAPASEKTGERKKQARQNKER